MFMTKALWAGGVAMIVGSAVLLAAPEQTDSSSARPQRRTAVRLTRPWNQLKDLTEEEKGKILAIHGKAEDQIRELRAKEHQDILAVLSDQQKQEVVKIEEQDREQARERRSRRSSSSSEENSSQQPDGKK